MGDLGRKLKEALEEQEAKKKPIGDAVKTVEGIVDKMGKERPIIRGAFGENLVIVDDNGLGSPDFGDRVMVEYISYGKGAYSFGKLLENYTPRQNEVYEQQERMTLRERLNFYKRKK